MSRDSKGHEWGETFLEEQFPLVCIRCLCRGDSPTANLPCDAVAERVAARDRSA